jgi:hypothetical protein
MGGSYIMAVEDDDRKPSHPAGHPPSGFGEIVDGQPCVSSHRRRSVLE